MQIINGTEIARQIITTLRQEITDSHLQPRLDIVLATNNEAAKTYARLKQKRGQEIGITVELHELAAESNKQDVSALISTLNQDTSVHGIIVQLPLYDHLRSDTAQILNEIFVDKDVDGLCALNQGLSSQGIPSFLPATVSAVLQAIKFPLYHDIHAQLDLSNQTIVIVNHSNLVGKPLSMQLLNANATVIVAHEFTKDLGAITRQADILVTGTGQVGLITAEMIKQDAIVIDVSSIKTESGVKGDIKVDADTESKVSWLTPVPGGIGPMTIANLLRNITFSAKQSGN